MANGEDGRMEGYTAWHVFRKYDLLEQIPYGFYKRKYTIFSSYINYCRKFYRRRNYMYKSYLIFKT
jgi:hypothetical protein